MHQPLRLYKYRDISTEQSRTFAEDIIVNKRLYFATPSSFNDPFEWRYTMSMEANEQEKLAGHPNPGWDEYGAKYFFHHLRNSKRVLSLSAKNDDILMWAHYANSHRGICIEFDASDPNSFFGRAKPVSYQPTFPELNIFSHHLRKDIDKAILTKSDHWAYEEEWRIVDIKSNEGAIQSYPGHLLLGIILGCEISKESENCVRTWVAQINEPITIYRARLSRNMYSLRIEPEHNDNKSA